MANRTIVGRTAEPISLHPQNPHYFLFREKPVILITSGEHYGSVTNLDFNYTIYLDELHSCGLNHTRLFSGIFREVPGGVSSGYVFKGDTMVTEPGRYICPWNADNSNKYNLNQWDEAYFSRLKDFCRNASEREIVIEFTLFCPHYKQDRWDISPMNINNNINGIGNVPINEVFTMKHKDLLECQTAVTRKLVCELNSFDNIIFEICNEPYIGDEVKSGWKYIDDVQMEWQYHIADTIVQTEADLPFRHLISQNICNGSGIVENPHKEVSVFTFHYASPPDAVTMNYGLNKVIGMNETGFAGTSDYAYRYQAWELIMAGGALYNNLDSSFSVGYENGTFMYPDDQATGGSKELRRQLKLLKDFMYSFNFIRLVPDNSIIKGPHEINGKVYVLAEHGKAYAMYTRSFSEGILDIDVPVGKYRVEWINPKNGSLEKSEEITHNEGLLKLTVPPYKEDISMRMMRI